MKNIALAFLLVFNIGVASATTINFDGTGAPCCFSQTTPLRDLYAPQDVIFRGVDGTGGSIVNQNGGFGFYAHSGTDFLAFNAGYGTGFSEDLFFNVPVSNVSIWAASIFSGTFDLWAYDANQNLVGYGQVSASSNWTQLAVSAADVSHVRLTPQFTSGAGQWFAYDDLQFSPVPVPAAVWLLGSGLLGLLGFIGVDRKRKAA